jgi:hypothetical protein
VGLNLSDLIRRNRNASSPLSWKFRGLAVGAWSGLALGVTYSVGGFFVDLLTTGLNLGTLMAFGALIGMPLISALLGFLLGALLDVLN